MVVKMGIVKTPQAILGTSKPVTQFQVTLGGKVYSYIECMLRWAKTSAGVVFIPVDREKGLGAYVLEGSLDGSCSHYFLEEWVQIITEAELPEDDPRVEKIMTPSPKGRDLSDIISRLFGGQDT